MSVVAMIKDGKVVDQTASKNANSAEKTGSDSLDKEAFLKLLVAQMRYQDPLEPTSNTEYVSQLATFSSLEAMNNMNASVSISRATDLVGQRVIMTTTSAGETYMVQGVVDYVVIERGKAYLAINDGLYSIDDLDTVVSKEYWDKYDSSQDIDVKSVDTLKAKINNLPEEITLEQEETIIALRKEYSELSLESQKIMDAEAFKLIKAEAAITLLKAQAAQEKSGGNVEESEGDAEEI